MLKGLKVDFHVHSHFSPDGDMPPEDIVKLAKEKGLDAIAVTDHNTIEGGKVTKKLAKGKDLVVFVGSEIKTMDGEIIGIGLRRDVEEGLSLMETCELIKRQNGFIIVPHPFDRFRRGIGKEIKKIIKFIDAVEVFNARTLFDSFNRKSMEFAEEFSLSKVAGSDAHFGDEMGSAYTLVDASKEDGAILKAVKEGKSEIFGKKTGLLPHWRTFVTKTSRRF